MTAEALAICGDRKAGCRCELTAGHAGPVHVCSCNGAWEGPDREPLLYPEGRTPDEAVGAWVDWIMGL